MIRSSTMPIRQKNAKKIKVWSFKKKLQKKTFDFLIKNDSSMYD
jgi:hypothetical protein